MKPVARTTFEIGRLVTRHSNAPDLAAKPIDDHAEFAADLDTEQN